MEKPNFTIGMTAIEVLQELVRIQPGIGFLNFGVYTPSRNVKEASDPDLSRLLTHYPSSPCFSWNRDNITEENIKWGGLSGVSENEAVVVMSDVLLIPGLSSNKAHIPMMDFFTKKSFSKQRRIEQIIEFLQMIGRQYGVILDSGRDYHFYGLGLLDEHQWQNFLADCLLSELADRRYVAHQLRDKCCVLRLTACPLRPKVPEVVAVLR